MARKKSDIIDNKIQLNRAIMAKQLPILTLDSRWHMLFPEETKTPGIRKLEKQVNELLKRQGKLVQDAKELKNLKRKFMQEIVMNMNESTQKEEASRVKKLDSSQKYIKEINEKLIAVDDELEALPKMIRQVNQQLMIESVSICYSQLHANKQHITKLDAWITEMRNTLKERAVQKQEMEQVNANIYSYMHDMLGPQIMEIFDAEQRNL